MNIGFDAKRLFLNRTGLGNYSRDLVRGLLEYYPNESYHLFTPSTKTVVEINNILEKVHTHTPYGVWKLINSYWRSFKLEDDLLKSKIDVFHGLSNEIPQHRPNSKIKYVVTVHDLIFLQFPEYYSPIDRSIYNKKFQYAANTSDIVVATSIQTKSDLINKYNTLEQNIKVVYQTCNNIFKTKIDSSVIESVKKKYKIPENYILNVGTIEERKNLELIVKAIERIDIPLVVLGKKTSYFKKVVEPLINKLKINNKIIIIEDAIFNDFPSIYQGANVFVYPSKYEGFGIPILEALYSKTPVITSNISSLPEVGGKSSLYVNQNSVDELTEHLNVVLSDVYLRNKMIEDGYKHALNFNEKIQAKEIYDIYQQIF